jgi:putative DNA primase/helicase
VTDATAGYRADQDVLGLFLADECVLVPGAFTAMSALYDAYKAWCPRAGIDHPWSREAVRDRLLEREGLEDDRTSKARGVRGVGLRSDRSDAVTRDHVFPG